MFFDDSNGKKSNLKPRLRLAQDTHGRDGVDKTNAKVTMSARERLENARFEKESKTSLLDQIDAMTRADEAAYVARQQELARDARDEEAARFALEKEVARIAKGEGLTSTAPEPLAKQHHPSTSAKQDVEETLINEQAPGTYEAPYETRQVWTNDQGTAAPLVHPVYVINAIRKWRSLIAATTILGGLIGVATAISTPKLYYSSTGIIIDPRNYKVVENDINPDVFLSETSLAIVDSQLNVIRSPAVMNKVATQLKLKDRPEFNGTKKKLAVTVVWFL